MPRALVFLFAVLAIAARARAAEPGLSIEIEAEISLEQCTISGRERLRVRNGDDSALERVDLLLFADRFREEPELDDLARHHLLEGPNYRAGGVEIVRTTVDGRAAAVEVERKAGYASRARIALGRALARGDSAEITIEFAETLPNLRDAFGCDGRLLVAAEGWPLLPLGANGALATHDLRVELTIPDGAETLLGGNLVRAPARVTFQGPSDSLPPLVVSARPFEARRWRSGGRRVAIYTLPRADVVQRSGVTPTADEALVEALPAILARSPSKDDLTIVRLPFGWLPSFSSPGATLVSDRLFELFAEIRPLHVRELAYAIFLGEEIEIAREHESEHDAGWVAEGLAWRRAQDVYLADRRRGREVREWIDLFGVFAIVDRFETAPRIPLLRSFFPVLPTDDALRLRLDTTLAERPPGRILFAKLESRLRAERFSLLLDGYRAGNRSLRSQLDPADAAFVDAWLHPTPEVDYRLREVERSEGRVRARIEREGDAPDETVEVTLEDEEQDRRALADLEDGRGAVEIEGNETGTVVLDPDRRLLQTSLEGDRDPPGTQVLLDSADVEVSSTEFGFSTLFVGRRRYDYRKDLAAAAFVNDRGYGLHSGFQLHGGKPIDRNLFRENLFLYYAIEELDRDFGEEHEGAPRAGGQLSGFGLRFNHYDSFWFENPSRSHHVRLFLDGYDRSLGSRYGFVRTGGSASITHDLRADTVVALQLVAGFTLRTGDRPIPPQGLFSLGGFRSIRGIGAGEDLDRHLAVVRAEVRRLLPVRLDLDLDEIVIARRLQVKAFVDAGRVARDAGRLFEVSEFAVGAGVGVNLFYDFLGFFPTSFYLDLATRVDRRDSVQVLFGARQPF